MYHWVERDSKTVTCLAHAHGKMTLSTLNPALAIQSQIAQQLLGNASSHTCNCIYICWKPLSHDSWFTTLTSNQLISKGQLHSRKMWAFTRKKNRKSWMYKQSNLTSLVYRCSITRAVIWLAEVLTIYSVTGKQSKQSSKKCALEKKNIYIYIKNKNHDLEVLHKNNRTTCSRFLCMMVNLGFTLITVVKR